MKKSHVYPPFRMTEVIRNSLTWEVNRQSQLKLAANYDNLLKAEDIAQTRTLAFNEKARRVAIVPYEHSHTEQNFWSVPCGTK